MNFKEFYLQERKDDDQSVGIVLFNGVKMLIVKRGDSAPWMPSKWSLAGGMVDEGEELLDATLRELYEETKIKPDNVEYLNDYDNWHIFTGETDHRQTDLEMENSQHDWITIDLIDDYDFVPYAKQALMDGFEKRFSK